jgi:hypothetical protein
MKCARLLAAGLMAISTTASAGGYVGLGVGTEPGVNDEMATTAVPLGRSLRGFGGIRFGRFSIEGALNGFGVVASNHGNRDVFQLSAAAKYNHPLGNGFEVVGRAGLERTWLNLGDDRYNFSGNGFLVGAGFEYRLDLVITNASLFVDYTIHHATLTDTRGQVPETSRIWALGFTVGI